MNVLGWVRVAAAAVPACLVAASLAAQPAPPVEIAAPAGAGPTFGRSVAVDGSTLIVGAPGESAKGPGAGAAYVYERRQGIWTFVVRLAPDTLLPGDAFGHAVAIHGTTIVVGAPGDDTVRDASGTITSTVSNKGAAYLYERNGSAWSLSTRVDHVDVIDWSIEEPHADDGFGFSVAAGEGVVIVGVPLFDGQRGHVLAGIDQGALVEFERQPTGWRVRTSLTPTTLGHPANFAEVGRAIRWRGQSGVATGAYYAYPVSEGFSPLSMGSALERWTNDPVPASDGTGFLARFTNLAGLFATGTDVLVNDSKGIRQLTDGGVVSTLAPMTPDATRLFESSTSFLTWANGKQLFRSTLSGTQTFIAGNATFGLVDGTGAGAGFGVISAVAPDGQGNFFVADFAAIRKVTAGGAVTTVAGITTVVGDEDGPLGVGRLGTAQAVAYSAATQTLFIADRASIRMMAADGTLTTIAGVPAAGGFADGSGNDARFRQIRAIALAADGALIVADGSTIRRVTPAGVVTTVLGIDETAPGPPVDGTSTVARFVTPKALAFAPDGTLFVADDATIRKVSPTWNVVTVAGRPRSSDRYAPKESIAIGEEWLASGDPEGVTPLQPAALRAGTAWVSRRSANRQPQPAIAPPGAVNFAAALAFSGDTLFASDVDESAATGRPITALLLNTDRWLRSYDLQPADLTAHPLFGASLDGSDRFVVAGAPKPGALGAASGAVFVFDIDTVDTDDDGLPDSWERRYGLDPVSGTANDGGAGDPDGDGVTNAAELAAQTHPTALASATRYFAEGARSAFFATEFSIANPATTGARVLLRYAGPDGSVATAPVTVPARASRTVAVPLGSIAEFATRVESDAPVVIDRIMSWGADAPYGSHGERALTSPSTEWYFAEGATHSGFDLFYLLYNPADVSAAVRVRYLRGTGGPLEKIYEVGPGQRFNVWVDLETFGGQALLADADVSARIEVLNAVPIIAERAMYRSTPNVPSSTPGALFAAGHESAGVTAPAMSWFFAEGATNDFFDLFILIANPHDDPSTVRARFLLGDGRTFTKDYVVAGNSRFNIWVDRETFDGSAGAPLANAGGLSTTLDVLSGPAIVAERAMWWPGPTASTWIEAHNSPGATVTAARWVAAAGHVTSHPELTDTYYLLANPGNASATVTLTLLFEGDDPPATRTVTVPAHSRFTVNVRETFVNALRSQHFSALVETSPSTPIVVEWAVYRNAGGQQWAAGANALATPIP